MSVASRSETPASEAELSFRAEVAAGEDPQRPIRRMLGRTRAFIARYPWLQVSYRVVVGVLGGTLALGGLVLVPLPGPGWLVVFLGLAILGTEFHWARRISSRLKRVLERFWAWWRERRARKASTSA